MRTTMSGAAAMKAVAAFTFTLTLLASAPDAAAATTMCVSDDRTPQTLPPSGQLLDQMEGRYQLSNGQRVTLHRVHQRLWIDFGPTRDVPLDRVGETRFTSRDGSVDLDYRPDSEQISMRYPADERGRFMRVC